MIRIMKYGETPNSEIFARSEAQTDVSGAVAEILANVKENGDRALFEYEEKFDKVKLESLRVSPREIDEAMENTDEEFIRILKRAAENITAFHAKQKQEGFTVKKENGVIMGQRVTAVDIAGMYVPGGTAAYPSTVLMDSIPAKIAGVGKLVMTTPPGKDGKINPAILAAAKIAGVDTIYKVGGAQAIGALAFGTESIPKADVIVGPGNAYVAEAKKQIYGMTAIDMIAGPSEILIVADGKGNPSHTAADLLSQAEHDVNASAVLVTDSMDFALRVRDEIEKQLSSLERENIARASIDGNGKIIVADTLDVAIDISNEIAPEHLELCVDDPFALFDKIKHAGSVFLGRNCPEALGDYMAGPNHTLPTGGTAKFSSPLSVDAFTKKTQFTYFTNDALSDLADDVAFFAKKEGLTAHARSAVIRTKG